MFDCEIELRPEADSDLDNIPRNLQKRIIKAIENRLMVAPDRLGKRLSQSLLGLWRFRVGNYRVVYEIEGDKQIVTIGAIHHRKEIYYDIEKRWLGRPYE